MKRFTMLLTGICMAALYNPAAAQAPAGYVKGSLTLSDGKIISGYVKDIIKKDASVGFADAAGASKTAYDGSQLNAALIDTTNYLCFKGDFFKTICTGKICFLQKASNASGKASYNGADAVFVSGTEGKVGDYFVFSNNELIHLSKKTVNQFINSQLAVCTPALEKARGINGDIALLAEAVSVFNQYTK